MSTKTTFYSFSDLTFVQVSASELTPLMIDWLVARFEGISVGFDGTSIRVEDEPRVFGSIYSPSTDPALGHPLLEREKIQCRYIESPGHALHGQWFAQDCLFRPTASSVEWKEYGTTYPDLDIGYLSGPTMLIAGLRFIIAKLSVGKCPLPQVRVPSQLVPAKSKRTGKQQFALLLKRISGADRIGVGLHFTPEEVQLLGLTSVGGFDDESVDDASPDSAEQVGGSHEERLARLSKRVQAAYKAGHDLECSKIEVQILGLTSIVTKERPAQASNN